MQLEVGNMLLRITTTGPSKLISHMPVSLSTTKLWHMQPIPLLPSNQDVS